MASPTQQHQQQQQQQPNNYSPPLVLNPTPSSTHQFNYPSFSQLLEGVVKAANSSSSSFQNASFKGQLGMSHQEALASVTAKAAQVQFTAGYANPTLDASPVKKPELSVLVVSDIGLTKTPLPETKDSMREGDKKSLSNQIVKTPNSDGYNWRKYGQKQVKSSESFRSYYRCTNAGCLTKKKVLHADKSGCIVGVDYKGHHNHDPPTKAIKEKSIKTRTANGGPVFKAIADTLSPKKQFGDSDLSASGKVNEQVISVDDKSEPEKSNNCHGTISSAVEEQHDKKLNVAQWVIVQQPTPLSEEMPLPEEPSSRSVETNQHTMTDARKETDAPSGQKRRMKDRARAYSEQLQKAPKQTKIVVHEAEDVHISADGYRWRKYGQKMVKGNPHPRSYYKCTSAGCPARKHVEKATDNSTAMMVTYEGKHDHDKPVPKKHLTNGNSPPEKAAEVKGTEKVIESARTLLSIGIELKSC